MNKFEQLIEYIINDEEVKARELFHDVVVEKSREIYENLMADEAANETAMMGGDSADNLIDEITADEEGVSDEADAADEADEADEAEADADAADDYADEVATPIEDIEDRVVDIEDKLDELMAEFESMMADENSEQEVAKDDSEKVEESVTYTPVGKVCNDDTAGNKQSPVAANSGTRGAVNKAVNFAGSGPEKGRPAPTPETPRDFQAAKLALTKV